MFSKPFRLKSCTTLKASDRRRLILRILCEFPLIGGDQLNLLFPQKEEVNASKIVTNGGNLVTVYCILNTPLFFEVQEILFPTLYFLWKLHDGCNLLPVFVTYPQVFNKLASGADLMLPGIVLPPDVLGSQNGAYGDVECSDLVGIILTSNRALCAVGQMMMSSEQMVMAGRRGKAVSILHFAGDHLSSYWKSTPLPMLGPPLEITSGLIPGTSASPREEPQEGASIMTVADWNADQLTEKVAHIKLTVEDYKAALEDPSFRMDRLAEYCLFRALTVRKFTLPILSSTFFRQMMVPECPVGLSFDIRKTSHKKVSKFFAEMADNGILRVTDLTKGVESIIAVDFNHPHLVDFGAAFNGKPATAAFLGLDNKLPKSVSEPSEPTEVYTVTTAVSPLFSPFGLKKGETLSMANVRKYVTNYVKGNNLQSTVDPSGVILDQVLRDVVKTSVQEMAWPVLMDAVLGEMTHKFQIASAPAKKFEPIDVQVANRSGNKKVTLVYNLELFGVDLKDFSKKCQHQVAASCSISEATHRKGKQLLIQGNQVYHVGKILQTDYKIPARYIRGLEKAVKPK